LCFVSVADFEASLVQKQLADTFDWYVAGLAYLAHQLAAGLWWGCDAAPGAPK
jgi:hypothetical protein